MTRRLLCAVVVGIFCSVASAASVSAAEMKIGTANLAKIFDSYERTKTSDAVLAKKGQQKEAELEAKVAELKKLREGLELLSDDMRENKSRQIERKTDEIQLFRKNTAEDLRRERDKIAKDILEDLHKGIEDYAKANGYTAIFDNRSVLYSVAAIDVTDELLSALNSKISKPAAAPAKP